MINEIFMLLAIVVGVVFFLKIFGKLLHLASYALTIAVLSLLIISFFKPEIKQTFIDVIKNNMDENSAILKDKITGSTIIETNKNININKSYSNNKEKGS